MLSSYEVVFIITSVLSDEQIKEVVNGYKKFLNEAGATIVYEESWGLKKLSYPIKKKNTGYYHLFQIEAPGTAIVELETAFRRDECVLRYLSVFLDKHALKYSEKRKTRMENKRIKKEDVKKNEAIIQPTIVMENHLQSLDDTNHKIEMNSNKENDVKQITQ
ncbi:MAG: 30S ribosomal protein S6 [Bacteroidota bacterium]